MSKSSREDNRQKTADKGWLFTPLSFVCRPLPSSILTYYSKVKIGEDFCLP